MPLGLTNREAGRRARCSHGAIAKAKASGHLATLPDGSVSPEALAEWDAARRTPRGGNQTQVTTQVTSEVPTSESGAAAEEPEQLGPVFSSRNQAELHRDSYAARLKQIEYDLLAGSVVHVDDVAAAVASEYAAVRTRLLALPSEIAAAVARLQTPAEVQAALAAAVHEALEHLTAGGPPPSRPTRAERRAKARATSSTTTPTRKTP
jgi:hypothetical protein